MAKWFSPWIKNRFGKNHLTIRPIVYIHIQNKDIFYNSGISGKCFDNSGRICICKKCRSGWLWKILSTSAMQEECRKVTRNAEIIRDVENVWISDNTYCVQFNWIISEEAYIKSIHGNHFREPMFSISSTEKPHKFAKIEITLGLLHIVSVTFMNTYYTS